MENFNFVTFGGVAIILTVAVLILTVIILSILLLRSNLEKKIQEVNLRLLRKEDIVSVYQALAKLPVSCIQPERYTMDDYFKSQITDHISLHKVLIGIKESYDLTSAQKITVWSMMTNYILRNINEEKLGSIYFSGIMARDLSNEDYAETMNFIEKNLGNNGGRHQVFYESVNNAFAEYFKRNLTDRNKIIGQAAQFKFKERAAWMNK
jgi:hypothetical protein